MMIEMRRRKEILMMMKIGTQMASLKVIKMQKQRRRGMTNEMQKKRSRMMLIGTQMTRVTRRERVKGRLMEMQI